MPFGLFDISSSYAKPRFFLAKPNKQIISRLKELDDTASLEVEFGFPSRLNFNIPFFLDKEGVLEKNPNFELIRGKFLIKMEFMGSVSWFVIQKITKDFQEQEDYLSGTAFTLEYSLNGKSIYEYEKESILPDEVLDDILEDSGWRRGEIDPILAEKYRTYKFSDSSVLNSIQETAKTLDAIPIFDTVNQTVSLSSIKTASKNTGLRLSDKNYIENLSDELDSETNYTRLYPIGVDSLTINDVNPLGTSYIEDFSYYLYPFERDSNRNVIKSSHFMSDSLAHAILDYNELVESKKGDLQTLQIQLAELNEEKDAIITQLEQRELALDIVTDRLDIRRSLKEYAYDLYSEAVYPFSKTFEIASKMYFIQARVRESGRSAVIKINGISYTLNSEWKNLKIDLSAIENAKLQYEVSSGLSNPTVEFYAVSISPSEFNETENQLVLQEQYNTFIYESELAITLNDLESQEGLITNQKQLIEAQVSSLSIQENFTEEQIKERRNYIYEYFWVEETHVDAQELYDDALVKLKEINKPSRAMNISIYNFLNSLDEDDKENWEKLKLGGKLWIAHSRNQSISESILMKISYDFEESSVELTISDTTDILDDDEKLTRMIYQTSSSVNRIDLKKSEYDEAVQKSNEIENILNQKWDATLRRIVAGVDESVEIGKRGVIIRSASLPTHMLVAQAGVLAISEDGGRTFRNALTTDGLIAEEIVGQIIIGEKLFIQDENGIISIKGNLQTIKDADGITRVELGEYEEGKYGLRVWQGGIQIEGGLPPEQIDPEATSRWNSAENNAKEYADIIRGDLQEEISDVQGSISELTNEIETTFRDGIISEAEAKSIATYLNILELEKQDLDKRYFLVYNNENLPNGVVKDSLYLIRGVYETQYINLVNSINTAIFDGKTTPEEKQDVDNKFITYTESLVDLTEAMEEAINLIETTRIDGITIGGRNYFRGRVDNEPLDASTSNSFFAIYDTTGKKVEYKVGEMYTFSFDYEVVSTNTSDDFSVLIGYSTDTGNFSEEMVAISHPSTIGGTGTIKYTFIATPSANTSRKYFGYRFSWKPTLHSSKVIYKNIKLEKGSKATDWSPAPEDMALLIGDKADQSLVNEIMNDIVYKIEIYSSKGLTFKNGQTETVLTASVYRGKDNITDLLPDSAFKWSKFDKEGVLDSSWTLANTGVGKTVQITEFDVEQRATIKCDIEILE